MKTWQEVGSILGIGSPTTLGDGRITFRVSLPADSPFGPGYVWLASNWGTPDQFLKAMTGNRTLLHVVRLAAEADPADIAHPDLAPSAPSVVVAPNEPPPFDPNSFPGGETGGTNGDLGGDPVGLTLKPADAICKPGHVWSQLDGKCVPVDVPTIKPKVTTTSPGSFFDVPLIDDLKPDFQGIFRRLVDALGDPGPTLEGTALVADGITPAKVGFNLNDLKKIPREVWIVGGIVFAVLVLK